MLVDQDDLSVRRSNGFGVSLRIRHLVSGSLCQIIQACLILVCTGDLLQSAACEVFKARFHQLYTDLIIIISACLMGIEGSIPPHNRPQIIFFAFISYFLLWDWFVIC